MFCDWEHVSKEQVLNNLKLLKLLFSNKSVWISWPLAENQRGYEVHPTAPDAVRWCFYGASEKLTSAYYSEPLSSFIDCATKDYLNELSDDALIKGESSYEDEMILIDLAIFELEK